MKQVLPTSRTEDKIWFFLLSIYIILGYIANDTLLPSVVHAISLYTFLGYSALTILGRGKIRWSPIVFWEIAVLILAFFAMMYSEETEFFTGTFYALIVNAVIVIILVQMPWTKERFHLILKTFVISAVILMVWLAASGNLNDETGRLGEALLGNANQLAMMLMVSAIYCIWLLVITPQKTAKIYLTVALIIIYVGMFLSGGRKYVLIPFVSAYILMINAKDRKGVRHPIRTTIIILVAAWIVYQVIMKVPFFYNIIGFRFEGAFAIFDDSYTMDHSTSIRLQMIDAAWERWTQSPLVGYGFDSFKYYNQRYVTGQFYYSHNNFVELLYNQGLLGFIGYYSLYIHLVVQTLKSKISAANKGMIGGTVLALLFFEYFGISYSVTPVHMMLFFAAQCMTAFGTEQSNPKLGTGGNSNVET